MLYNVPCNIHPKLFLFWMIRAPQYVEAQCFHDAWISNSAECGSTHF